MKHLSLAIRDNLWRRMNRACGNIGCFKTPWLETALAMGIEEFLKKTPNEQIENMRKEKL